MPCYYPAQEYAGSHVQQVGFQRGLLSAPATDGLRDSRVLRRGAAQGIGVVGREGASVECHLPSLGPPMS
jgi:hypothetical protein